MSCSVIVLITCPALLWVAATCVYRLFFHPLARYPGPLLARLTNAYAAYHAWNGDGPVAIWRCHCKYGDYVRYGPNCLVINRAQAFQDIYGFSSTLLKAPNYAVLAQRAPSILTIRNPAEHRLRRHRVTQALSDDNVRSFELGMLAHIRKFCAQMLHDADSWSPTCDISPWCNYLLFDMMMSIVFASRVTMISDVTHRHIPKAIHQLSRRQNVLIQSSFLAWLASLRLAKGIFRRSIRERNEFVKFIRSTILARDNMPPTVPQRCWDVYSFLHSLPKASGSKPLSPAELSAECATLIVAGSETTSTSLAALFFYLARYRSAYAKAAEEVRSCFCTAADVRIGATLSSCTYLRACIQESLRLSPPVGTALPREVQEVGALIDGTFVPAGCLVGASIYSLQRKPDYFSDPFTFRPERWLSDYAGAKDLIHHEPTAYGPFQIGPRSCVGKSVAMQELMLTMATTLCSMDFEAVTPGGDIVAIEEPVVQPVRGLTEYPIQEFITAQGEGPLLRFRRRDTMSEEES